MAARIGIDVTSALTQGGGIGRYTRELVRALATAAPDVQFNLFSAKPPDQLPVPDPLPRGPHIAHKPAPVDERWLYRIWYRARLPLPVQWMTGGLDLFHSPDFVLPPVSGHIPTLLTVHDLSFIHYADSYPATLVGYLNRVVPWSVARATHVLADSAATKRDLLTLWGVPDEKVTVLYSGVNEQFAPVDDVDTLTAVRRKYDLGDQPFLLSVGTIQPRKNYQMLIQAFAAVADRQPHQLYIAGGRGWLYDDMLAEVSRQGLEERVRFIGFVDDADLPALYSAADLFLFPSIYEGFGLPLLEAMACGTAVVTSNASCLPEVAGDAAVLLPPSDRAAWSQAINHLLTDDAARNRLADYGRGHSQTFSWHKAARQLLSIYHQLLNR